MKSFHLWLLGMTVAGLVGLVYHFGDERARDLLPAARDQLSSWIPQTSRSEPARRPVTVILASNLSQLHRLRLKLGREYILADSAKAFALRGGSVVASDLSAASGPINALGWSDRPLEILSPRARKPPAPSADDASPGGGLPSPERSLEVIRDLAKKDTLTQSEAWLLLEHLE